MRRLHTIVVLVIAAAGVYWVAAWAAPNAHGDLPASQSSKHGAAGAVSSQALIARSCQRLLHVASLSGRVRVRTNLLGERFIATGRYEQQGDSENPQFRLEMRAKVGGQPAGLLVVGDGDFIWQQRTLPSSRSVARLDLSVSDAEPAESPFALKQELASLPAAWRLPPLPRLLHALATQYHVDSSKGQVEADIEVYQLHAVRTTNDATDSVDNSTGWIQPPGAAPGEVTLSIGRRDLFPYRIRFAFHPDDENDMPRGGSVDIQFYEVRFDAPIDQRRFHFTRPRDLPWQDITPRSGK